jgi:hypothetical protein
VSKAKAMGTAVESAAVRHLQANGYPDAERIVLHGSADHGDILLRRRPTIVAECKRAQRGVQLGPWIDELVSEKVNAAAEFGLLIMKQKGAGDKRIGCWATAMPADWFMPMMERANHFSLTNSEILPRVVSEWQIGRINSVYVPDLVKAYPVVPRFIVGNSPGRPDRRFVVGRLASFLHLMSDLGYAEQEGNA